jgi:hypothetical protein
VLIAERCDRRIDVARRIARCEPRDLHACRLLIN